MDRSSVQSCAYRACTEVAERTGRTLVQLFRMAGVRLRRVYEDPSPADGTRVLVDRIWPRGLRKDAAHFDEWLKEVAPSTELRTWYGHEPDKFDEFRRRYLAELKHNDSLDRLKAIRRDGELTVLTATRDVDHSHAAVLAKLLC